MVSFRLGGGDGVSVEAAKWKAALELLGYRVRTVAGEGPVDCLLPGLAIGATVPPAPADVRRALEGIEVVVVENLCSLPLNPPAAQVVAETCSGRPTILHHHDLPWQRPHLSHFPPPPDDPAWRHVTINRLSQGELATRGIEAVTVYNAFDPDPPAGRRRAVRRALGVDDSDRLVLQPTRALPRKRVEAALALTEALGGVYWLLGPAEDGFGPELERLLAAARCPVRWGPPTGEPAAEWTGARAFGVDDAYAACDVVALPSSWEGFGNPSVESATHRRPLAVGPYPVANELASFGFHWFDADRPASLAAWLEAPVTELIDHNHQVARCHFSLHHLPGRIEEVLASL
jgi:glycosyltransferase involved in cell wall biosynthesis